MLFLFNHSLYLSVSVLEISYVSLSSRVSVPELWSTVIFQLSFGCQRKTEGKGQEVNYRRCFRNSASIHLNSINVKVPRLHLPVRGGRLGRIHIQNTVASYEFLPNCNRAKQKGFIRSCYCTRERAGDKQDKGTEVIDNNLHYSLQY